MSFLPEGLYLWIVALHVIFVIFWMAGLFMMPRYFAYHMECGVNSGENNLWIEREARLLRIIMNPAMIIAWIAGLSLAVDAGWFKEGWFHGKLLFVIFLTVFHMILARTRRHLAAGNRTKSSKFYRLLNEVPAFAIIAIVILVEVKPF